MNSILFSIALDLSNSVLIYTTLHYSTTVHSDRPLSFLCYIGCDLYIVKFEVGNLLSAESLK